VTVIGTRGTGHRARPRAWARGQSAESQSSVRQMSWGGPERCPRRRHAFLHRALDDQAWRSSKIATQTFGFGSAGRRACALAFLVGGGRGWAYVEESRAVHESVKIGGAKSVVIAAVAARPSPRAPTSPPMQLQQETEFSNAERAMRWSALDRRLAHRAQFGGCSASK